MSANKVEVVPGTSTREAFDGVTSTALAETASTAVAAKATATVQARYIMALQRPRDLDDVRVKLLKECNRPRFAEVARYLKPVGKGVSGPSIRFAEAAIRCMTNVTTEVVTIFDDSKKRIVQVTVTDLESNVPYSLDVTIEKTVERSSVKPGQTVVSTRVNSYGKTTFLVEATEDDLLNKQAALISKAIRQLALRLLPGDILDEAMDAVTATQEREDKRDPDAARKRLVDAFAQLGVKPSDLKQYLGHELSQSSPAELAELRSVYSAIRDGEGTWADSMAAKTKSRQETNADGRSQTVKDKVAEKAAKAKGEAAASPPAQPASSVPVDHHPDTGEVIPSASADDEELT